MALNIEQIAEAAQSLRDDPTFAHMSLAERHVEAKFLVDVQGGDGDDVSAVVDWALGLESTPPARGVQFRGHIPEQAAQAEAARRAPPAAPHGRSPAVEALPAERALNEVLKRDARPTPPRAPAKPAPPSPIGGKLAPDMPEGTRDPLIYVIKQAGGGTERDLSALLGVPRSTIQAYACGRIAESYTSQQFKDLLAYVGRAREMLGAAENIISQSIAKFP